MSHQTQSPDFNALYSGGPFRGNGGRDASPGSSDSHENGGYVSYGYEAGGLNGRADEEQPILPAFNQASPMSYPQMARRQPSELELPSDNYGLGASRSPPPAINANRRVSLRDDGPTETAEPVRRVPRSSSKRSSFSQSGYQTQPQQTYRGVTSPNANPASNLPPGAVSGRAEVISCSC